MKVTLHEMIHALKHDRYEDTQEIIDIFKQKYNLSSTKINTHEAYTEIWANLINCFLLSQKYMKNNKTKFIHLVSIEKYWYAFSSTENFN